ncbi:hypothetical protein [Clostridium sp.]|uniref:hypothetical protein n=1 Tax=Clostridium sp. TaxID=1506 RepID=UPI003217C7F3
MNKEEANEILGQQFELIAEICKTCESELICQNIRTMLDIYSILFPYQGFQEFVSVETKEEDVTAALKRTAQEVPVQEQLIECGSCYKDTGYLAKKLV